MVDKTTSERIIIIMNVLLLMIFMHIVDDYYLQGWLANGKQKLWWKSLSNYSDKYKYDYIVALFMHSFSWSFMIMTPILFFNHFDVSIIFYIAFFTNVLIHGFVDNLKANKFKINLIQDQLIHVFQIVVTFLLIS